MRGRAPAAAAALLALALTACGGGGGGEEDGGPSTEPSQTAVGSGGLAEDADPAPPGDGLPDEMVPPEELTPSGGEFTEEQQEYLTERVPRGVDPAAILELGTETCDRIGYLDRHDPEAAAEALRSGELPDAEAAIEHLCPEYADLLAEAAGGAAGGEE
ncbi:hypothetical protein [Streptomyces johnsoniae]|uniref:DUF732 domain-containing protein n=1 Tax=Streptomyces johnsoniae TaxID=3075532 RepID=A0ABU2S5G7_9ACTN|nr:hypothetical protein [Streptomyces sp. DSM 41886]MDT0444216.1 hypothetical protein [Streptomyces sp. DSM 41886]